MDSFSDFFNSDLGKQLTNLGTEIIRNELKLNGSGYKDPAVVQVPQTVVQQVPSNMTAMYWVAGGIAVVVIAFLVMRR